jgi:hypothetical protein
MGLQDEDAFLASTPICRQGKLRPGEEKLLVQDHRAYE